MKTMKLVMAAVLCGCVVAPALAARVSVGIGIPLWWGPPAYYYPPPVYYAPPVYASPVVVPAAPVTYVQAPAAPAPAANVWYYCVKPQGYYPYVQRCPGGWQQVAPTPPDVDGAPQ